MPSSHMGFAKREGRITFQAIIWVYPKLQLKQGLKVEWISCQCFLYMGGFQSANVFSLIQNYKWERNGSDPF